MLAKFPSKGRPNSLAISESAGKPQTLLRDSGIADGQSFFSLLAWENWSSPKAVTVVMSAAGANVTIATAFAFRSGTDGSEGHRAIADMRCWLAARVDRPLADDSPVQESADSRQRLCEAAPQGEGNVWPAAPCCPWVDFSDAKVTCRCRMASVFIANRLKSSSLFHEERISGSCQRHLPIVMRRSATFVGHRKIDPRTARSKGSKPRGKKLNSNISKNETLRHLSDSCLRSTLHRQR